MSAKFRLNGFMPQRGFFPVFDIQDGWQTCLQTFRGQRITVTIQKEFRQRTNPQNRRYWRVIVPGVQEHWNRPRIAAKMPPLSKDAVHYALKCGYIGIETTPLGPVPRSSKELSVEEFTAYCDQIEAELRADGATFPGDPPELAWDTDEFNEAPPC